MKKDAVFVRQPYNCSVTVTEPPAHSLFPLVHIRWTTLTEDNVRGVIQLPVSESKIGTVQD